MAVGRLILYHGTSRARYDTGIKTKGLQPGKTPKVYSDLIQGYSDHNIYLTSSVGVAENYATRAALEDRSKAVVLAVEVNDLTKFRIDEDTAGWSEFDDRTNVHFSDPEWKSRPDAAEIMDHFQKKMLKAFQYWKTVAYQGSIPASKIKILEEYKPVSMKRDPSDEEFDAAMEKTHTNLKNYPNPAFVASEWVKRLMA